MEYILIGCVVGIVLCAWLLYHLTFGKGATERMQVGAGLEMPDFAKSDYKEPGGFWSDKKPVPVRDIPFTRAEKEEARAMAALEAKANESQPVPETVNEEIQKPKFDYPNFGGFPCDSETYDDFAASMMKHGFVIRFIMASHEVQVIYTPPKSRNPMEALRRLYSPPREIFPANLLHDEGRMRTALWAMRHFKKAERPDELEAFIYL